MDQFEDFIRNLSKLHTTNLGEKRVQKNLNLEEADVIDWCRKQIKHSNRVITRSGKNYYIEVNGVMFTVNASSYTLITAHPVRSFD